MSQICQCPACEQFLAIPDECGDDVQIRCPKCQGDFRAAELAHRQAVVAPVIVAAPADAEQSESTAAPTTDVQASVPEGAEGLASAAVGDATELPPAPFELIPSDEQILVGDDRIVGSEEAGMDEDEPVPLDFLGGTPQEIAAASASDPQGITESQASEVAAAAEPILAQEATPADESLPPVAPPADEATQLLPASGSIMQPTAQFDAAPTALAFGAPAPAAAPLGSAAPAEADGWAAFGMLPTTAPGVAPQSTIPTPLSSVPTGSAVAAPAILPSGFASVASPGAEAIDAAAEDDAGIDSVLLGVGGRFQPAQPTAAATGGAAVSAAAEPVEVRPQRISSRLRMEEKSLGRQLLSNVGMIIFGFLGLFVSYYVICLIAGPQMNIFRLPLPGIRPTAAARSGAAGTEASSPAPAKKKKSENPFAIQEGSAFPDLHKIREMQEEKEKAKKKQ